eukprot:3039732-Amphidinium_carterae.1
MVSATTFFTGDNLFTGMLPVGGLRAMTAVTYFSTRQASLSGPLPESGIRALRVVGVLEIAYNCFRGVLPEGGIRAMMRLEAFSIHSNGFTGLLPDLPFAATLACVIFAYNWLAGALPGVLNRFLSATFKVTLLDLEHNYFEGSIPQLDAQAVYIRHTLLAGSIPSCLLDGGSTERKLFMATDFVTRFTMRNYCSVTAISPLECEEGKRVNSHDNAQVSAWHCVWTIGTIPKSASRMSMAVILVSLGSGLSGVVPNICGTVTLISFWENGLEGQLPEMRIIQNSVLLVHANDFSCNLPRNREVKPTSTASLALIGNHFAQPRKPPAWITTAEQPSDMFCVSNEQAKRFIMLFVCGACVFCLMGLTLKSTAHVMLGRFARARSA